MKPSIAVQLTVLLLATASHVSAQNTVLQPALFADSLSRLKDSAIVRGMEKVSEPRRDDASPEEHLRFALIEKRLFELTDDDEARKRAQHSFDKVKDQDEKSTWGHFGYGWAIANGPEFKSRFIRLVPGSATIAALGSIVGLDAAARAKRSLQKALEIDPAFEPAVTELARLALLTRQPKDVAVAASASRKAIGAGRATAGVYRQLAELELLRGDEKAAAEAARAAMALKPDAAGMRALGMALVQVKGEVDSGAEAYLGGLNSTAFSDSTLLSAYMNDVAPLLNDDDRDALKNLSQRDRSEWLAAFWNRSAAKAGRTLGQRLGEHFRRMQFALENYQRTSKFGVRPQQAIIIDGDNQKLPFDDRGLIYVRLGEPQERISTPPGDLSPRPNESWVYSGPNGEVQMYHFHRFADANAWVLSPLESCDPFFIKYGQSESDRGRDGLQGGALSRPTGSIGAADRFTTYIMARAKYDPRLATYASRCEMALADIERVFGRVANAVVQGDPNFMESLLTRLYGPPPRIAPFTSGLVGSLRMDAVQYAAETRTAVRAALKTEDARPRYERPLQAITQLYAFRGAGEATSLSAAVLIPGQRFTPQVISGVIVYPLEMSLIVIDSVTGRIQRADSKPKFRADQSVASGQWFRATLDMQVMPMQQASYRVVIENTANSGEGDIRSGSQAIPSFVGDALMISDLVVGEPGDGRWKRGKADINPIPSHQIEKGRSFKLFYEIYNLAPGTKYRTTVNVAPRESGGLGGVIKSIVGRKSSVSLNFDDDAAAPAGVYGLQQLRTISADMDAGQYDITVTITNTATQTRATRKTKLVVLGPKDLKEKKSK